MRAGRVLFALFVLLLVAAPSAFAGSGGFAPVSPASPNAADIRSTYWIISGFVVAIFLLVEVTLVLFILKYRRRNRARIAEGAQIHGSTRLETMWTVGPVIAVFVIFAVVLVKLPGIVDVPSAGASGGPLEVRVAANQFSWQYTYPNGVVTIDRLLAPVGVPVRLSLSARDDDVIHSWWVPALGGKIDAIPGRVTTTWFQADRAGTFKGRCAELCGVHHANMTTFVEARPRQAFDAWYAETDAAQSKADTALGEAEWKGVCAKCHGLSAEGGWGPALSGATLTNVERVTSVVRNGGRVKMPPVGAEWTQVQMDSLNDYLEERFGSGS